MVKLLVCEPLSSMEIVLSALRMHWVFLDPLHEAPAILLIFLWFNWILKNFN